MSEKTTQLNRGKSSRKHRVGRVTIYLRGKIWYIYYCENGGRVRRRVGVSLAEAKRLLRDKGVIFILETCRAMFNYAAKHRHLPPYHENPFAQLNLGRIPIEDAKPIELFTSEQEEAFWAACDNWQFPIFLTMALTGLRPGEVVHLLLPNDVDWELVNVGAKVRHLSGRNKTVAPH